MWEKIKKYDWLVFLGIMVGIIVGMWIYLLVNYDIF